MKIDYKRYRAIIESHYGDRMTVYFEQRVADPRTHGSKLKKTVLYKNLPCHLDWGSGDTMNTQTSANTIQNIRVLLAPEPDIKPGSTIEIMTEAGRVYTFKCSSPSAVVPSHQEIALEVVDKA